MDTVALIISLMVGNLGILVIILGYQKDRTSKQHASKILVKRIFKLTLVIAMLISIVPVINHFKTKPPPPLKSQEGEQIYAKYMGEKPSNPPIEEVKSEIEKELKAATKSLGKRALDFYQKGSKAYENNQFKEAITLFKQALEIVKIPSFYLSIGNSHLVTGDFRSALKNHHISFSMYRNSKDKKGESKSFGSLGITYSSLGQYEKAIDYYNQALVITREIGDRQGEGTQLGNLGNAYSSLGQYEKAIDYLNQVLVIAREIGDHQGEGTQLGNLGIAYISLGQIEKARQCFKQSLAIFDEIKSPHSEHVRKVLDLLETLDTK